MGAWRALALHDALNRPSLGVDSALYLDASTEVRRPLDLAKRALDKHGYFALQLGEDERRKIDVAQVLSEPIVARLSIDREDLVGVKMCATAVQGYVRDSAAYHQILTPAAQCSLESECAFADPMLMASSSPLTLSWGVDPTAGALTALMHKNGLSCHAEPLMRESDLTKVTLDPTRHNDVVLLYRGWKRSKPYSALLKTNDTCSSTASSSFSSSSSAASRGEVMELLEAPPRTALANCLSASGRRFPTPSHPLCRALTEAQADEQSGLIYNIAAHWASTWAWLKLRTLCTNTLIVAAILLMIACPSSRSWLLRHKRWVVAAIVLALVWHFYYGLLLSHGTFAPHNVWLYSHLYVPKDLKKSSSNSSPSVTSTAGAVVAVAAITSHGHSGKLPRIVFSLTTMPHQVANLGETIESLLAQDIPADAIYLSLPYVSRRSGQPYLIPDWMYKRYLENNKTTVRVLRSDDFGPLTKLVPALETENDPDTLIVTVDSDKIYPKDLLTHLVKHAQRSPDVAFGVCGWGFYWMSEPAGVVPLYVPWSMRGEYGRETDVLQACCGNAYRRRFFADLPKLKDPHPKCFTTDDLWIAGYLATVSHVKRVLIPGGWSMFDSPEPATPEWKKYDEPSLQLSTLNTKEGADYACLRGVEQRLGPWRKIREFDLDDLAVSIR